MLLDLLTILLLSFIPASANYFLDYCFGRPMSEEPSTKAIFHKYPLYLATRRLKKNGLYESIVGMYFLRLNAESPIDRNEGKRDLELQLLKTGRDFFFTEQALGMCPYCTNFWFSEFSAFFFFFTVRFQTIHPLFYFVLIPIFSHSILRKILNA
jgi:hypothetical protein